MGKEKNIIYFFLLEFVPYALRECLLCACHKLMFNLETFITFARL